MSALTFSFFLLAYISFYSFKKKDLFYLKLCIRVSMWGHVRECGCPQGELEESPCFRFLCEEIVDP